MTPMAVPPVPDMVRALLDYAREPITVFDGETFGLVGINQAALDLMGLTRAQLVDYPNPMALSRMPGGKPGPGPDELGQLVSRVMAGERVELRFEIVRPDGKVVPTATELVRLPGERPLIRTSLRDLTLEQASARTLLDLANEVITVFDFETFRIVDCNEAAERLFQRTRDELRALDDVFLLNAVPEGSEAAFRALHRQMLEKVAVHGERFEGQYDARRKDGTKVPVYADVVKIPGSRAMVRTSMRDLRNELDAEEKYRAIVENAPQAITLVSADGLHESVNPSYQRIFGYQAHEIRGLPVPRVISEEQPDGRTPEQIARGVIARVLAGEVVVDRHVCRRADGSRFPAEVVVSKIPGNPVRVLAMLTDLSERDALQAAAEVHQARFRALFENAPDAIAIVNEQGLHEDVNPAYERLMRTTREQMRTLHPLQVVAPEQPDGRTPEQCVLPAMESIQRTGRYVDRHHAQRLDGTRFPCEIEVTLLSQRPLLFRVNLLDLTEPLRLQAEAQQSEARYQELIQNAPEAIYVADIVTNEILEVNPSTLALFGVDLPTFRSRPALSFSAPIQEGGKTVEARLSELVPRLLAGERLTFKWYVQQPAGLVIPTEMRVVKLPGTRSLVRVSVYDLRERERAEVDARLRELTSQLNGAVFECVRASDQAPAVMTAWSDRAPELLGPRFFEAPFSPEELIASFHPDDRAALGQGVRDAIAGDGLVVMEVRRPFEDGTLRWVLLQVRLTRNAEGARVWRGFLADITERQRTVELLKKADERFRALFERLPVAVLAADATGRFQWSNPALRALDPASPGAVAELFTRWGSPETAQRVAAFFAGGERRSTLPGVAARTGAGDRLLDVQLYRDEEQGLVVLVDITEREASARALAEANRAMAAANRELEAFSYSVSHDLRAPLRHIDGFSRALEEDCASTLPPIGLEHLSRIRRATQRMGRLIDDLLGLSRVTRTELKPQPVDVTRLCRELAESLKATWPAAHIEVQPGLSAWADEGLLRVALQNLLDNACKYSSKTPAPRVTVTGQGTTVTVEDNGVGFDMAYAGKLFAAFQRLHREADFPGTGVGLATVQRVVLRHGGSVRAEARPGVGARFTLELPAPAVRP